MQLPEHSWAFSNAMDEALRYRVSKLNTTSTVAFDSQAFMQRLLKDPRTHDLTHDDMCSAFSHAVEKRTSLVHAVEDVGTNNVRSLAGARAAKQQGFDLNKITVDDIVDSHAVVGSPKRPTGSKMIEVGMGANFKKLSTEQKLYGGMSLLIAGMSALGAFNSLTHSVTQDANGNNHIQWSNVGIGLFSAAIAAGSAYAAHAQLRSAPAI
jgi:hypothetical protein